MWRQSSKIRKSSRSESSKTKARIQKLLTQIVRIRDGGCIFRHYPESGGCSGYTAADHIISRQFSATYGDLRNVICVCNRHHIFWKPQNPILYIELVSRHIGVKDWQWISLAQRDRKSHSFSNWDWVKVEIYLGE